MWYIELILIIVFWALFTQGVHFVNLLSEEQLIANECFNLIGALKEVQEHSRGYHYMNNMDFRPLCYIYKDHYEIQFEQNGPLTRYDLPDDIRIDFYDSANFFVFRQKSLYNAWTNKTIKVYKGKKAKYIIVNRIGRIRLSNWYEESS